MMTTIDPIQYSDPFKTEIGGRLAARFRLDANRKPLFVRYSNDRRLQFYTIELLLKGPYRNGIRKVDYFMDHPSFQSDPSGSSTDSANEFPCEIETYGDVEVIVTAHVDGKKIKQRAWLSQMLDNNYAGKTDAAVKDAIGRIRAY